MDDKTNPVITFVVPEGFKGERADKVLANHFTEFSRTQIQGLFEAGQVQLRDKVIGKNERLNERDVLEVAFLVPKASTLKPVNIPLDILYEDEDIVVVNKTAGMVVHPGNATGENTLCHALLYHTEGKLSLAGGEERAGVVHRLDKETSGAILFAKTDEAYVELIKMFAEREVDKEYLAIVDGVPRLDSGCIKNPIGRNPRNRVKMRIDDENGREAHTEWEVEGRFARSALLRCFLYTGRTHQIRVHLSHIGHPILGDNVYGYRFKREHVMEPKRVMLHSERLGFRHPITGEGLIIRAPLPKDFQEQLDVLTAKGAKVL